MNFGDTNKNKQLSQNKYVPKMPRFLQSAQNVRDKYLYRDVNFCLELWVYYSQNDRTEPTNADKKTELKKSA